MQELAIGHLGPISMHEYFVRFIFLVYLRTFSYYWAWIVYSQMMATKKLEEDNCRKLGLECISIAEVPAHCFTISDTAYTTKVTCKINSLYYFDFLVQFLTMSTSFGPVLSREIMCICSFSLILPIQSLVNLHV